MQVPRAVHLRRHHATQAGPIELERDSVVEDPGAVDGKLRVTPSGDGPLVLTGPFAIRSADGKTMLAGTKTKLCRCGQSQTKPFCDGSHKRVEFKSA